MLPGFREAASVRTIYTLVHFNQPDKSSVAGAETADMTEYPKQARVPKNSPQIQTGICAFI